MTRPVLSTYRLQMRGDGFTFADAIAQLDYFASLGVSHLYLSPILTAVRGSTHGYDVTDPSTVSAALGGADGLADLAAAAHQRDLGLIVDIVPNHVGVGVPEQNRWWWDVLRLGRGSEFADFFDIDWALDPDGRIVLPVLDDEVADIAALRLDGDRLYYRNTAYPVAPGTGDGSATAVYARQHYRLTNWRNGFCGYRRYFSVTDLAALRQEDPRVFAASHVEIKRWFDEGLVDGVRVDHPDGLADPAGYVSALRRLVGPDGYIVLETVVAPGELLPDEFDIAGSTGYETLREINGLFVDPSGEAALSTLAAGVGYNPEHTPTGVAAVKDFAETVTLASERARLQRVTDPAEAAIRRRQLDCAVAAKGVEDCWFYRDPRLVSLNEIGCPPGWFGLGVDEFHRSVSARAGRWPASMTTLSTHDTKRGEDVRARISVLSQAPDAWVQFVTRAEQLAPSPDPASALFLWQNLFGVWPVDGVLTSDLRSRLHAFTEKALREAATRTSWSAPDREFETATHRWLDSVFDGPAATVLTGVVSDLVPHAQRDSMAQKFLQLTIPGVPDTYQGSELWEDNLVDPDNRRLIDYAPRRAALPLATHPKQSLIALALRLRRERPSTFISGAYTPILATGSAAEQFIGFMRGDDVVVAVSRWSSRLSETGWGDTTVTLPPGNWTTPFGGVPLPAHVTPTELFPAAPVAVLIRQS